MRPAKPRLTGRPEHLAVLARIGLEAGSADAVVDQNAIVALVWHYRVRVLLALVGCAGEASVDSTPQKLDGTQSHEFEQDDLDAAAVASDAVKAYCADAVSEAQRLGCESHVTGADLR